MIVIVIAVDVIYSIVDEYSLNGTGCSIVQISFRSFLFSIKSLYFTFVICIVGIKNVFTKLRIPVLLSNDASSPQPSSSWPDDLVWILTDKRDGGKKEKELMPLESKVDREQTAFLQYTSGSTSEPKGVM